MEQLKGCITKHAEAKAGCKECNELIEAYHKKVNQLKKLNGMSKAYGAGGNAAITKQIKELVDLIDKDVLRDG